MTDLHELIRSIETDLANAHRQRADQLYKLAYNRGDEDIAERVRHLGERITMLTDARKHAWDAESIDSMHRAASAMAEHVKAMPFKGTA